MSLFMLGSGEQVASRTKRVGRDGNVRFGSETVAQGVGHEGMPKVAQTNAWPVCASRAVPSDETLAGSLTMKHELMRSSAVPAKAVGAQSTGALALGGMALGAIALGAVAIGALVIGRLVIGRARIKRLEIDNLVVRRLHITEQLTTSSTTAPGPSVGVG
jgi:hypothetical protein